MSNQKRYPTLAEYRESRKRCHYRDLIKTGDEIAASFCGIASEDLNGTNPHADRELIQKRLDTEVLAYNNAGADQGEPSEFIEILDNGDYYLILGNYERTASDEAGLAELEVELYEWMVAEGDPHLDLDDSDEPDEGPRPC
ncbi:hypothetical protein AWH63_11025 [Marinobacter sp. C18]|uniref:hypothetical protein n=1 Tax=Marinobacter sp. C18 TaxID=1772288 RepID=UPI000948F965|nr:hypothetical protein [Marinobacter sp. C18]OLF82064.1 hypothetical protein AWH63_11025 [Marinobacter sp. C18]